MNRYTRTDVLYGTGFREKLNEAKVAVVGLGAVGSYTLESLARFGVQNLTLIDFDSVEESNLNRQLYALESTMGLPKSEVARGRVLDINSSAKLVVHNVFVEKSNFEELFLGKVDLIVDAIDSISSKCDMIEFALRNDIKIVSSMGAARRKDLSRIKVADIFKTQYCPLAARIRKELKKRNLANKSLKCVYSDEQMEKETHLVSGTASQKKLIGSSPVVTAAFGLYLANLAIETL